MDETRLQAAEGLRLILSEDSWRVGFEGEGEDWLGPLAFAAHRSGARWRVEAGEGSRGLAGFEGQDDLGPFRGVSLALPGDAPALAASVRAYADRPLLVFRLGAEAPLDGLSTGRFEEPGVAWPELRPERRRPDGAPPTLRSYAHHYCEFALPASGDAAAAGFTLAPHRPPVVMPLLFHAPGRALLIGPLDAFHEQALALPQAGSDAGAGIRCGWHGDLDRVPAGFATELAVLAAPGPRAALERWGALLLARHGTRRPGRYADELLGKLSYWTDNGAVYYYRTAPGCDYGETLEQVAREMRSLEVPIRSLQLDSWFYPHRHPRPVSEEGAPVVPPSGMLRWEPREDLFPDGLGGLRERLGGLPLAFHSRHFAPESPYFERFEAWVDEEQAHPRDPDLFHALMEQVASWGGITYEQDWLVQSFLGVRGLREAPGRARAWQRAMDDAADAHGVTLQWCMATPADFLETVRLRHVTSIRTSGDYRYQYDNGLNWTWFLHTNALARALRLWPFKDVFLSHDKTPEGFGDPYSEPEALLAALSAGPVGIGDQLGHTVREVVMRTCRADGVLLKPDLPVAALDRCFAENAFLEAAPLLGETHSRHPAGRWTYLVAMNASRSRQELRFRVDLADLGEWRPEGPVVAYDWRQRSWRRLEADGGLDLSLHFQDWSYTVLCPLLAGDLAVFGDVEKYATVADRRVARIQDLEDGVRFDLLGAPGERVEVHGIAPAAPAGAAVWSASGERSLPRLSEPGADEGLHWSAADGRWRLAARVGPEGRAHVTLHRA